MWYNKKGRDDVFSVSAAIVSKTTSCVALLIQAVAALCRSPQPGATLPYSLIMKGVLQHVLRSHSTGFPPARLPPARLPPAAATRPGGRRARLWRSHAAVGDIRPDYSGCWPDRTDCFLPALVDRQRSDPWP